MMQKHMVSCRRWFQKWTLKVGRLKTVCCSMGLFLSFVICMTMSHVVEADEIHGRLRWRKANQMIAGESFGYYLKMVDGKLAVGQFNYSISLGELVGLDQDLDNLPGEIYVVIKNNSEDPLLHCMVDIYSPEAGAYIVDRDNQFTGEPGMRFTESAANANWVKKGWHLKEIESDGKAVLYSEDLSYTMSFYLIDNFRAKLEWCGLFVQDLNGNEVNRNPNNYLEAYLHPMPNNIRLMPEVRYQSRAKAEEMIQRAGLVGEVVPRTTDNPAYLGYVVDQNPPAWTELTSNAWTTIGVPTQTTHVQGPLNLDPSVIETAFLAPNGSHYFTANTSGSIRADVGHIRGWERFKMGTFNGQPLMHGEQVWVRTAHNKLWTAGDDGSLKGTAEGSGDWEAFTIEKLAGSGGDRIGYGDQIILRGFHGTYVSASSGGGSSVKANGPRIGGWEKFTLAQPPLKSMKVAFVAPNLQNYVTVSPDNLKDLFATASSVSQEEIFTISTLNDQPLTNGCQVWVQAKGGGYWSAGNDGSLKASASSVSGWEAFVVEKLSGSPGDLIGYGDQIVLRGFHGTYVSAASGGGSSMKANGPRIGGWEKLTLVRPSDNF